MKRIYVVTYKPQNWKSETAALSIVASSVLRALQAAPKVTKRKGYHSAEITGIEQGPVIDAVV